MVLTVAQAMRLLAELEELDRQLRYRRVPLSYAQKQRRSLVASELHRWALARQHGPATAEQRREPRAQLRLRVQLLGGPRPTELQSDSLGMGGLSVELTWRPVLGDHLALRLVPPPPDTPV